MQHTSTYLIEGYYWHFRHDSCHLLLPLPSVREQLVTLLAHPTVVQVVNLVWDIHGALSTGEETKLEVWPCPQSPKGSG